MEILVVLAILAVLSSVALFSYGSYRKTLSVRSTAQNLVSLFSTARTLAVNSNRPHAATIDLDRQAFWVDELTADGTTITRPKITGNGRSADQVRIDDVRLGLGTLRTGLVHIRFYPDGRGTHAIAHLRRELDNPADPSSWYSVRVFPSTGAIQVLPNERR